MILFRTLRNESKRRVSLLIAQKSVHGFIGWASRQVGALPVGRAQDSAKPATGTIYLPEPIGNPTLLRGIGTRFDKEAGVSGMVFLPSVKGESGSSVDIAEIMGPEELRLKRPFKGKTPLLQLTGRDDVDEDGNFGNKSARGPRAGFEGSKYKLAAHIDQTQVYHAVFDRLKNGGCVGIFPEGGSHDRTGLLPLKAGVAIMALGTLAESPDCGLKIVPRRHELLPRPQVPVPGRHRVRAALRHPDRAGADVQGRPAARGHRRGPGHGATALTAVTVSTPDYDTLMMIQATRRLYNPTGKALPLPMVVELNRRLAKGYDKYKDDERLQQLMVAVKGYNKQLRYLNLRDHQVQYGKLPWWKVSWLLFSRTLQLLFLLVFTLPGLILFAPVFIASRIKSQQKAKEALAGSSVKIQGRDVMATWKLLVAMAFAPILYNGYCILLVFLLRSEYRPEWVPAWIAGAHPLLIFIFGWIFFPLCTYTALRTGEVGMDIFKSLRPLFLCLNPASSYSIQKLRERRAELSKQVTETINTLGPEIYTDFEHARLVHPDERLADAIPSPSPRPRTDSDFSTVSHDLDVPPGLSRRNTTQSSANMPRNESFSNIGRIGMFATRPPSRSRSRSSSSGGGVGMGGFPLSGFTTLDSQEGFDEASRKIRDAMRERGELRRRQNRTTKDFTVSAEDEESDGGEDDSSDAARKGA